ncbi:MAG TPA: carboxypeptidase-like regulatory domain-containing protein [Patescibacteria group bacterium]|nr:carboxypeptidase-like regulatory domain-containing protein [Patescibacteria group bacterium]
MRLGRCVVALLILSPLVVIAGTGGGAAFAQEAVGQVNGTVLGKDRKGVAGLTVAAIPPTGGLYGTSTDEGGRYGFKGLAASTYSIVVVLPDGGISRKDGIRVRPLFRSIVDFNIGTDAAGASLPALETAVDANAPAQPPPDPSAPNAASIACLVVGADRAAAPDAAVTLTPVGGAGQLRRGRTDPDGRCLIPGVPAGAYRISVRTPGFISWSLGPLPIKTSGGFKLSLLLVPFPLGFEGTLEDKLVPADPIAPARP